MAYFQGRFDDGPNGPAIKEGTRVKQKDPETRYKDSGNGYLRYAFEVAEKLLGHAPKPGHDYALTEAVRCKATQVWGVHQVASACAQAYLWNTLELSAARVVVCLGSIARDALQETLNAHQVLVEVDSEIQGAALLRAGRWTLLVLPHNGARGFKKDEMLKCVEHYQQELQAQLSR